MKKQTAKNIVHKLQNNYNSFAEEFSETRKYPWPEFPFFQKHINAGDKVLELGCGNGRFYDAIKEKNVDYTGLDFSEKLLNLAKKKHPKVDFIKHDIITYRSEERFDVIVAIATIHHVPSKELRLQLIHNIAHNLNPDGTLIFSVWDLWQKKYKKYIFKAILKSFITLGKYEWNDCFIPWKSITKKTVFQRYYHAFTKREIRKLLKKSGFEIIEEYTDKKQKRNFCFACKKRMLKTIQNPIFINQKEEEKTIRQPQPATIQKL